jgi:divalent metal cation (Fe/Co/Zn/Cd) transporter
MSTSALSARDATGAPTRRADDDDRARIVARGMALNTFTLAWNVTEAVIAIGAGVAAGSVALVGFGADSVIESSAAVAARWRLHRDADVAGRAVAERRAQRAVGVAFVLLAAWVAFEALESLWRREVPSFTWVGTLLTATSAIVMPLVARAKRNVARDLASGALDAEATQTAICAWLSVIVLAGLALHALAGWWWADPVAALAMVPIIAREGVDALRGRDCGCGGAGGMDGACTSPSA